MNAELKNGNGMDSLFLAGRFLIKERVPMKSLSHFMKMTRENCGQWEGKGQSNVG